MNKEQDNSLFILIISAVFPPEPVVSAKLSMDLYKALKGKGLQAKVLHPKPTRPFGFKPDASAVDLLGEDEITSQSYVCPQSSLIGRMRESWSFGKACAKYIKEHHQEIACIYANTWPMFAQRAIVKAAKKYNIPSVIHVQDVYPDSLTNKMNGCMGNITYKLILPMDKYILGHCTKVVAISEKMRDYLIVSRNIPRTKTSVVINWQDEQDFLDYQKTAKPQEGHPFTFMYMGNIGPVAGVDLLIEAFTQAGLNNAKLVVAGSGSMKDKLQEKAAAKKNIEFWDVPNGKVPEIQAKADVMMLPIKKGAASSSIPSKLPAYMFSAKPIIGCMDADSDTATAIKDADCGWVIEPENVEKLSETMIMVSALDNTVLETKAKKAQTYGLAHFSKKENLSRLVKVIEDIL